MSEAQSKTREQQTPASPALSLDPQEYLTFLDECDWSDQQKREFIQALWQIIVSVIEMNSGMHPVQLAAESKRAGTGFHERVNLSRVIEKRDLKGRADPRGSGAKKGDS